MAVNVDATIEVTKLAGKPMYWWTAKGVVAGDGSGGQVTFKVYPPDLEKELWLDIDYFTFRSTNAATDKYTLWINGLYTGVDGVFPEHGVTPDAYSALVGTALSSTYIAPDLSTWYGVASSFARAHYIGLVRKFTTNPIIVVVLDPNTNGKNYNFVIRGRAYLSQAYIK